MIGKYVPPGRRQPSHKDSRKSEENRDLYSAQEIKDHFDPAPPNGSETPHRASNVSGSLQDSAATPGKLAWVCLFNDSNGPANPRWDSDKIIFCKRSLRLLPGYVESRKASDTGANETTDTVQTTKNADSETTESAEPVPTAEIVEKTETAKPVASLPEAESHQYQPDQVPIAIFKQIPRTGKSDRVFSFIGYHTISHLEFLEPRSDALVRMLDQKWSYIDKYGQVQQKERTIESWNEALCKKWAVVKFKELDETKFPPPRIERLPDPEPKRASKKSVNEMLAELRMSGEAKKEAEEEGT
ncbi:hypothetical protein CB0940_01807 [Cercospora beticola]|uniref:Uncharacterized protein n=1 Tax=Cercospora beticola TaxID=122368 RepID=A0A2G5I6G2_CERBT|nr:hypothetical protein CB0940_01807 [Cercospora beticola]PIB00381.1 hypothetical protein CB0940_01807 [Cercospora beticola]WPA97258.1 hypothetical protein RHO25_001867 [Cercospora beticola]CAK1354325.1 unnamed protein product [Cercospora beticola]